MTTVSRITAWGWCLACCVFAGCCTTRQACSTCTAAASTIVPDIPPTYENYTPPPQPQLIPMPTQTPADDSLNAPPPAPATQYDPRNKMIDYFEATTDNSPQNRSR